MRGAPDRELELELNTNTRHYSLQVFTRATLCVERDYESLRERRVRLSVTAGIVSKRRELP